MSNGSSQLLFLDPKNKFSVAKRLNITAPWGPIDNLNSLFYHNHIIYANIWFTDLIAMISPNTGHILGWIDISGLYPKQNTLSRDCATANGITFNNTTRHLIITGKCWVNSMKSTILEMGQDNLECDSLTDHVIREIGS